MPATSFTLAPRLPILIPSSGTGASRRMVTITASGSASGLPAKSSRSSASPAASRAGCQTPAPLSAPSLAEAELRGGVQWPSPRKSRR